MTAWGSTTLAAVFVTAVLLGGMVFYSFVVTPLVFAKLPRETAGEFLREAFPVYYLVGGAASGVGALTAALSDAPAALALAAVLAGFLAAHRIILPRLDRHRDGRLAGVPEARRAFARWHRGSVALNLVQMIAVAVALLRLAGH